MEVVKERIDELIKTTVDNVAYVEEVANKIVTDYTTDLDALMQRIKEDIINIENPPIEVIERYFLELSNAMYFACAKSEKLSIYDGVSKSAQQEAYNMSYLDTQTSVNDKGKKPTVAESTAIAENAMMYEALVNTIYNRAYRMVKAKLDAGQTMISTLSKVMSRRLSEMQLAKVESGKQVLMEDGYRPF